MPEKWKGRQVSDSLRARAEMRLKGKLPHSTSVPPEEAGRLLHELQVHQFELEMQNDELRKAQLELEVSRRKYFDLYEMAPLGYLTVNERGLILEANLAAAGMLGVERNKLARQPLSGWIVADDQEIYYLYRKRLVETGVTQVSELRMRRRDGSRIWVRMDSDAALDAGIGKPVYRVILSDVTLRHQAEEALANAGKELEKRVDERTAELLAANRLMKKMLDEGKRAEETITKSRERLRNLSGRLQSLLEEERTRISREIHDELGQSLTALKLDLSSIRRSFVSDGLAGQSARIQEIERAVTRIIRTVQKISTELRPGVLDELGVAAAIEWMAKDFRRRAGIGCQVTIKEVTKVSDSALATALFRIVQEALTNVMRHAAASMVKVLLEKKGNALKLEVRDNGIGIKEERILDSRSLGIIGIRERVRLLGGELSVSGKPGKGTLVKVTLPVGKEGGRNA